MKTLAAAVLLCVSAAATAQAGPDRPRSCESWRCKPAPAPMIGFGIPVVLAVGGVLVATETLDASAAIISSTRIAPPSLPLAAQAERASPALGEEGSSVPIRLTQTATICSGANDKLQGSWSEGIVAFESRVVQK